MKFDRLVFELCERTGRQTDKSYGTMRHVRSGKKTRCIFFPLAPKVWEIGDPKRLTRVRSIVVGCRSRNDIQTDKQNGMTIRLTLCERDATYQSQHFAPCRRQRGGRRSGGVHCSLQSRRRRVHSSVQCTGLTSGRGQPPDDR